MADQNEKRKWWLAARNVPLVAGVVNVGLAAYVILGIRPGTPHTGEGMGIVVYLVFGGVMAIAARWVPRHGARVGAVVIGALPSCLLGFLVLFEGRASTVVVGVVLLVVWGLAVLSIVFFERGWTKEAVARAGCCVNCGYDRRGLGEGVVCPECGELS